MPSFILFGTLIFMRRFLFLLAISCSTAYALLPPLAQSIREIEAILADPRLYQSLGSPEMIVGIERNEQGYVVVTRNYSLQVILTYTPLPHPGPARFDLDFQPPEPISQKSAS